MAEQKVDLEKRLLAAAVFQLRVMLSPHIDVRDKSPAGAAAQLAYALHNQALAVLDGKSFDVGAAIDALARLEPTLGKDFQEFFRKVVHNEV